MVLKKYLLKNYLVVLDERAEEGIDLRSIKSGYIFNKVLSSDNERLLEELKEEEIEAVATLFSEDDTLMEKLMKTIVEYTFYDIPKDDSFYTVRNVTEKVQMVKVLNRKEFEEFCNDLVRMDKALDSDIVPYLLEYLTLDVSEIKNKEVKLLYLKVLINNKKWVRGYELIRYINYILTKSTLFINYKKEYANKKMRFSTEYEDIKLVADILDSYKKELAKYANTYKDFFVHIKLWAKREIKNDGLERITMNQIRKYPTLINRILRVGKTTRQVDLSITFDKEILSKTLEEQEAFFSKMSIKQLLKMINYISLEEYYDSQGKKDYYIRNQKNFIKEYKSNLPSNSLYIPKKVLKEKLIEKFTEEKEIKVLVDDEERFIIQREFVKPVLRKEWTTPLIMSDKRRSAGIYYKSSIDIKKGDKIGIIWYTNSDLDLSATDLEGNSYAWNSRWGDKTDDIEYSGDMRSLNENTDSAFENFTIHNPEDFNGIFRMNVYSDRGYHIKFNIYIERDREIIYKSEPIDLEKYNKRQIIFGYVIDSKFYLDVFTESDRRVAIIPVSEDKGKTEKVNITSFLLNKPVYTLEDLFDEIGIEYEKLDSNELGDKNYTIFE